MQLILKRMSIENFKGIKALEISYNEGQTDIRGENGTGKSSIVDAFCWALFDKDAHGNAPGSSFQVKPLGEDNTEIHNLTTAVELDCELDGAPFCLRRELSEKWTKPRGKTEQVFSGNVSAYLFNGVPMRQADYKAKVGQILSEELFRLVGTLGAFNAMKWQDRRVQLMALSDVDVDAQLSEMDQFAPLMEEAKKRGISLDELRKALDAERKKLNERLKALPIRIDEQRKSMPDFTPHDLADAEYVVKTTREDLAHVDGLIAKAKAEDPAQKRQALEAALQKVTTDAENAARSQIAAERTNCVRLKDWEKHNLKVIESLKNQISDGEAHKAGCEAIRDRLRLKYAENRERVFDPELNKICPCCRQEIPVEKRHDAFMADKKKMADKISAEGKEASEKIRAIAESIKGSEAEMTEVQKALEELRKSIRASEETIAGIKPIVSDEQKRLEAELAAFDGGDEEAKTKEIAALVERKRDLEATIARNQQTILRIQTAGDSEKRIAQLEKEQKECGDHLVEVERLQIMSEAYTAARCEQLTAAIDAKFPSVRWKLFDRQINGGLVDTCVCLIPSDGALVDYSSANTAAQVNADVEIINALSAHYGVIVPLFIDNAERVNCLTLASGQTVTLTVSADEELKIK